MKRIALAICVALMTQSIPVNAGKLDLAPEPSLAMANGLYFPGGGWFYLSNKKGAIQGDAGVGMLFLALTAASLGGGIYLATHNETEPGMAFMGFGFLMLRFGTTTATEEAIKRNAKS